LLKTRVNFIVIWLPLERTKNIMREIKVLIVKESISANETIVSVYGNCYTWIHSSNKNISGTINLNFILTFFWWQKSMFLSIFDYCLQSIIIRVQNLIMIVRRIFLQWMKYQLKFHCCCYLIYYPYNFPFSSLVIYQLPSFRDVLDR
jgi:hypothetical protein